MYIMFVLLAVRFVYTCLFEVFECMSLLEDGPISGFFDGWQQLVGLLDR